MTRRTRRNHTAAFKAKVALAAPSGETTLPELAQISMFIRTRSPIKSLGCPREGYSVRKEFGQRRLPMRRRCMPKREGDPARISELTLENFFESALTKAGMPSAKR